MSGLAPLTMTRYLLLILYCSLVSAQHAPVGEPSGNPFERPLNEIVPTCRPFSISWQPTTPNTITLVLLRGPAENIKPFSILVTGTNNSGTYIWTPSAALQVDTSHYTRYGLQLIDDVTGQYQYSLSFEVAKGPDCDSAASPSSVNTSLPLGFLSAASPTPAISSSILSAVTSSTPLTAASDKPQDTSSRGRLKPGIAAAIGIGATAGVALVAIAVFMAYRMGRKRDAVKQGDASPPDPDAKVEYLKPELHANSVGELHGHHVVHELHGGSAAINEMADPVAELHDEAMRKELAGGTTQREDD